MIFKKHKDIFIALILCFITLVPYWQVINHEFVSFDDDIYVFNNPVVKQGLTFHGIKWAFSLEPTIGNKPAPHWHPLTWLSHMLDVQFFGEDAGKHHLVNVFFHLLNVLLLFMILRKMTGAPVRSALVALLFSLHPVNVESVAWIAERKNLLSTFLMLLTIACYIYYSKKQNGFRYLSVVIVFALGLLAKSMLVSLPFVLLLLDYWPLERFNLKHNGTGTLAVNRAGNYFKNNAGIIKRLVLEKVFLIILSFLSIYIALVSLKVTGQDGTNKVIPFGLKLENAIVSYVHYLYKMIYPVDLTFYYPYPKEIPDLYVILSIFLIGMITTAVFTVWRRYKFVTVGWLWYLITLFPVLGLIQGGLWPQIAERWAYVPFIGIFIAAVWGFFEITSRLKFAKAINLIVCVALFPVLLMITYNQVGYWKNNFIFYSHAIEVNSLNYHALNNLGIFYAEKGKNEKALAMYKEVLQRAPNYANTYYNIAFVLEKSKPEEAVSYYYHAIKLRPSYIAAYTRLGELLVRLGKENEAMQIFSRAQDIKPDDEKISYDIASLMIKRGEGRQAIEYLADLLRKDPQNAMAHNYLGSAYMKMDKLEDARQQFLSAIRINPSYGEAHTNVAILFQRQGKKKEALQHFSEAVRLDPHNMMAEYSLGVMYAKQQDYVVAREHLRKAIAIDSKNAEARFYLAVCLIAMKKGEEALYHLREAQQIDSNHEQSKELLAAILAKNKSTINEINILQKTLQLKQDDPKILHILAAKQKAVGDLEESMKCLQRLAALQPDNPDVYYNIACIYSLQNNVDTSISYLNKAIAKGFNNWALLKKDPDLENVRQQPGYDKRIRKS